MTTAEPMGEAVSEVPAVSYDEVVVRGTDRVAGYACRRERWLGFNPETEVEMDARLSDLGRQHWRV